MRVWKSVGPSEADILCAGMHEASNRCNELLEKTANALNDNVVSVMLLAVQKGNLELSINVAVTKSVFINAERPCQSLIFTLGLAGCLEVGRKRGGK